MCLEPANNKSFKIAGYDVQVIDNKTAKVGCKIVTLVDVESLKKAMEEFKPKPKLKVGDWVRVNTFDIRNINHTRHNQLAKVILLEVISPNPNWPRFKGVGLEFALYNPGSHDLHGYVKHGHGGVIPEEELELVD